MLFRGGQYAKETAVEDNYLLVKQTDEVETVDGWKLATNIVVGDKFVEGDEFAVVVNIEIIDNMIKLVLREEVMSL